MDKQKKFRYKGMLMAIGATSLWGSLATLSQVLLQEEALGCVEPLVAFISKYFIFQHTLGVWESLGGLFIIMAVWFIVLNQEQKQPN